MKILIKDVSVCENCTRQSCSVNNVVQKAAFHGLLKTEQYTCPVRLIERGMNEKQLEKRQVDIVPEKSHNNPCVYCGLCAIQCHQNNLEIDDYKYSTETDFEPIINGRMPSEPIGNLLATSYLNHLYDFAANTNIIKPLLFDGYICSIDDAECFVEIDIHNDSLESCRRLLSDIVTYNHDNSKKINNGIMVLSNFPKEGSRDVYNQIEKIKKFPKTSHLMLYATTFALLRYYTLNIPQKDIPYEKLFYKIGTETKEEFLKRIIEAGYVTEEIANQIFDE
jgi:hypothetical protein